MISYNTPISDYIAYDAISVNSLSRKRRFKNDLLHEMRSYDQQTHSTYTYDTLFKNALRCALLEPLVFIRQYLIEPDGLDTSSQEGKDYIAKKTLENITLLKKNDFLRILEARNNVHNHPVVGALLREGAGITAPCIIEECPETGVKIKCRPDYVISSINAIFDLKIATYNEKKLFEKAIIDHQLHLREAFYRYAYECASHRKLYDFLFIVIGIDYPFNVKVFELDKKTRQEGQRLVTLSLKSIRETQHRLQSVKRASKEVRPSYQYC